MQSNKPSSKKTRQIVETGNAAGSETKGPAADETLKPRETRSSTVKKIETIETSSAKRHRKAASPVIAESAPAKAMAASAAASSSSSAPIAALESEKTTARVSREEIAKLAHSYWEARGYTHGNPEADWFRAESELLARG
jgi:hypothetical protein